MPRKHRRDGYENWRNRRIRTMAETEREQPEPMPNKVPKKPVPRTSQNFLARWLNLFRRKRRNK